LEVRKMMTEWKEQTGTDDYRTRLDILENLASVLDGYGEDVADMTRDQLDDIAHEVADQWPHVSYRGRVVQWLQAGGPDLDGLPAVEWVEDTRQLINDRDAQSVAGSINTLLGTVLYGVARAVIDDLLGDIEDGDNIGEEVAREMAGHRARLNIPDGHHALQPPYQWTLAYSYDHTTRVHVEARD
jgi:hypothetical protein